MENNSITVKSKKTESYKFNKKYIKNNGLITWARKDQFPEIQQIFPFQ